MGTDIDFKNPEVVEECIKWGEWYVDTTKIDIVLNNIKNPKDIEIIPYERKEAKMQERKIKIYKKILKIKGE